MSIFQNVGWPTGKNRLLKGCFAALISGVSALSFGEILTLNDGRQVELKADGSWEVVSEDIQVKTPDGRTVLLRSDGSWEALGRPTVIPVQALAPQSEIDLSLEDVFIEVDLKSASSSKNSRRTSSITYVLTVALQEYAEQPVSLKSLAPSQFKVVDSRNKDYKVVSVKAGDNTIEPGRSTTLRVRTNEAPSLLYTPKTLTLNVSKATVGLDEDAEFEVKYRGIDRRRL